MEVNASFWKRSVILEKPAAASSLLNSSSVLSLPPTLYVIMKLSTWRGTLELRV